MATHRLTAHLVGGLGNQMFQYAAARALSHRNGARLYLDVRSGFARDTVYKRTYELGAFPIEAAPAGVCQTAPFLIEAARRKITGGGASAISARLYGASIMETQLSFMRDVAGYRMRGNAWMRGFWQSERYFREISPIIGRELSPPAPRQRQFLECARLMDERTSVAVGVRLFEEVPGASKAGVGGLTPIQFFNAAAAALATRVHDPVFFVFCTTRAPQLAQLSLPGAVHFVTHDDGFEGSVARLWLMTRCRHHIISNSSFYWWGAWLRESRSPDAQVIASPSFPNRDTVPARWTTLTGAAVTAEPSVATTKAASP